MQRRCWWSTHGSSRRLSCPRTCPRATVSGLEAEHMDNLASMSVFVRAADARSFTEAGTQLGVSPSAIGKTIARLEERLGVRLFHRSTRSITLTPEGILYLQSCRRIFFAIYFSHQELASTKKAPLGLLRVSLPMVGTLLM